MSKVPKKSRCGFVVIKLRIDGDDYFLMRRNPVWKDINFIGGHEKPRDGHSLLRAARRELLEEVPALRACKDIELRRLTSELTHGPVYSPSAAGDVEYELELFVLQFSCNPKSTIGLLGARSPNVLVRQADLLDASRARATALVGLLNENFTGGLQHIPYSWSGDIGTNPGLTGDAQRQQQFALD